MWKTKAWRRVWHALVGPAVIVCAPASAALAQGEGGDRLVYGGVLGDVQQATSDNPGKIHVAGNVGAATADYFRGGFDDVPADLDQLVIGPDLSVMFELREDTASPLDALTLTLGTQNNFAEQVQPVDSTVDEWYESNNFAALSAGLGENWLAGVTYTAYSSPNDVSGTAHEVALAAAYAGPGLLGSLGPQLKLAIPVDEGHGAFAQLSAGPSRTFFDRGDYPLSVGLPVTLGVGFDDYYGPDTEATGYVDIGLTASVPLTFIDTDYGEWIFSAGFHALLREQRIVEAGGPFDDEDNLVPFGTASISFVY